MVQIGLGVALMAAVHPLLPLLLGGAALPSLLVRGRAARRLDAAAERTAETARLEQQLSETVTGAEPAKEVRLSGAAPALDGMAARRWEEVSAVRARAGIRAGLLTFAGSATFLAGYAGALGHTAWLAGQGAATAGTSCWWPRSACSSSRRRRGSPSTPARSPPACAPPPAWPGSAPTRPPRPASVGRTRRSRPTVPDRVPTARPSG
ncbi:hypothetical protein ACFQ0B_61130 [Nonomuraea thailandensis]